jgi:hypothetical protein
MEYDERGIIRFLCNEDLSSGDSHQDLRHDSKKTMTAHVVFGDGASMFGKDAKTYATRSPGKPPIELLGIRIQVLLGERAFDSSYSIADSLRILHSIIISHLR